MDLFLKRFPDCNNLRISSWVNGLPLFSQNAAKTSRRWKINCETVAVSLGVSPFFFEVFKMLLCRKLVFLLLEVCIPVAENVNIASDKILG